MAPQVTTGARGSEPSVVLTLDSEDGQRHYAARMTPDEARAVAIKLLEQAHTIEAFVGLQDWP